jgi:hypothetical protein
VRHWKRRFDAGATAIVAWSLIGMILAVIEGKEAGSLLADWRKGVGVGMRVIADSILCVSVWKRSDRQGVPESCR